MNFPLAVNANQRYERRMSEADIFLIAPPGLEDVVRAELLRWCPNVEATVIHGGVSFKAALELAFGLNCVLKTPTRILWRIAQFRAKDFPKLFNRMRALPWADWVQPDARVDVQVSTRLSRLKIKSRIEETCLDALTKARGKTFDATKPAVTLFVRLFEDECTLSLDTSGERLHKRGARTHVGAAPLRETLAAALIEMVFQVTAGRVPPPTEILDPMVGSGTFLLEAAQREMIVDGRQYAFESLVGGEPQIPGAVAKPTTALVLRGWDADAKTLKAAQDNLKRAHVRADLAQQDVFKAAALPKAERTRWVFANPPYGERIRVDGDLGEYYVRLFEAVHQATRPDLACFLLGKAGVKGKMRLPEGWRVLHKRALTNGGLPVVAFIFGCRPDYFRALTTP